MMQKYWIRAGIVGIVCLISWVAYISSKQLARNERIENEVSLLQREAEKIRRENETLSEKIHYFATVDFQERVAKDKLSMKKEDEEVIVIKARPEEEVVAPESEESQLTMLVVHDNAPNYQKWWQLFFGAR